jgi:hypothetical protein
MTQQATSGTKWTWREIVTTAVIYKAEIMNTAKYLNIRYKERRGSSHLKEEGLDRTMWRARFGRGFGPVVRQTTK